jgi:hypothetical protein
VKEVAGAAYHHRAHHLAEFHIIHLVIPDVTPDIHRFHLSDQHMA